MTTFNFLGVQTFSTVCVLLSISIVIDSDTESSFCLCWRLTLHTVLHRGSPEDCADLVSINHLLVINADYGFKVLTFFGIFSPLYFALFHFVNDLFCSIYFLYDDIDISHILPAQGYA